MTASQQTLELAVAGSPASTNTPEITSKAYIHRLPPEILLHGIFLRAYPRHHYWRHSQLAKVSKYFYSVITPHMYSYVNTIGSENRSLDCCAQLEDEYMGRLKPRLMDVFENNKTLASYVRTWEDWPEDCEWRLTISFYNDPDKVAKHLVGLERALLTRLSELDGYLVKYVNDYTCLRELKLENNIEIFNEWGKTEEQMKLPQLEILRIWTWYEFFAIDNEDYTVNPDDKNGDTSITPRRVMKITGLVNVFLSTCPRLRCLKIAVPHETYDFFPIDIKEELKDPSKPISSELEYARDLWLKDESRKGVAKSPEHAILSARDNISETEPLKHASLKEFSIQSVSRLLIDGHEEKQVHDFVARLVNECPELRSLGWDVENKAAKENVTIPTLSPAIRSLVLRKIGKSADDVKQTIDYLLRSHPDIEEFDLRGNLTIFEDIIERCKVENEQQQLKLNKLRVLKLKIDFSVESGARFKEDISGSEGDLKYQTFSRYLYKFIQCLPSTLESLTIVITTSATQHDPQEPPGQFATVYSWAVPLCLFFRSLSYLNIRMKIFQPDADEKSEHELVAIRRPRLCQREGKCVIRWWLENDWEHLNHRKVQRWESNLLTMKGVTVPEGYRGDGTDKIVKEKKVLDEDDSDWEEDEIEKPQEFKDLIDDDDDQSVAGDEELFEGPDGNDWWYPPLEYESMKHNCPNCEEEARKYLKEELKYEITKREEEGHISSDNSQRSDSPDSSSSTVS